jgi:nucleoside-diphosphate-sugar epimerase
MSPDSKLTFPSYIKTVLITGASGFVGRKLVQLLLADHPHLRLITTDIHRPPTYGIEDEEKLIAVAVDLADKEQVGSLFGYGPVQGVFALQ